MAQTQENAADRAELRDIEDNLFTSQVVYAG